MKNVRIKVAKFIVCLLFLSLIVACSSAKNIDYTQIDDNLKINNISMSMKENDVLENIDSKYTKEPCILGEEYKFKDRNLQVVFDVDDKSIKRLTTKEDTSTLYGIKINDKVSVLTKHILDDGFTKEANSDYKFVNDKFRITILSQDGDTISGYMIDVLDNED